MKKLARDEDSEMRCICIDLQQTLPLPRLATSVACYKKLWMYNLCIDDMKIKKSKFYVWGEVMAGHRSVDIATCVKKWNDSELSCGEFSALWVVSDNYGQNRSINLILMYLRELHVGNTTKIDHYCLVPGHSYIACNRAIGNTEKSIRATGNICDFLGYCTAIAASTVEQQDVIVMRCNDFLDFNVLQKKVTVWSLHQPYSFQEAHCFSFRQGIMKVIS